MHNSKKNMLPCCVFLIGSPNLKPLHDNQPCYHNGQPFDHDNVFGNCKISHPSNNFNENFAMIFVTYYINNNQIFHVYTIYL